MTRIGERAKHGLRRGASPPVRLDELNRFLELLGRDVREILATSCEAAYETLSPVNAFQRMIQRRQKPQSPSKMRSGCPSPAHQ